MKLSFFLSISLCVCTLFANAAEFSAEQSADPGKVDRYYIPSPQLGDTYAVDVWIPEDYNPHRSTPYPVVYAQDGQNLYDPTTTWNGQSWNLDGVIGKIANDIDSPVIVGIHNRATRAADYLPHNPLKDNPGLENRILSGWEQKESRSDRYLDFIINTVKPAMEEKYNIRHDADGVTAMGSSMGGLISLYAMCEYPDVFSNAICMSTHWLGYDTGCTPDFPEAMIEYLDHALPADGKHRLYLDHGTKGFDASYEPWDTEVYQLAIGKGYVADKTIMHVVAPNADHNEYWWSQRVDKPLLFILGIDNQSVVSEIEQEDAFISLLSDPDATIHTIDGRRLLHSSRTNIHTLPAGIYIISTPTNRFTIRLR